MGNYILETKYDGWMQMERLSIDDTGFVLITEKHGQWKSNDYQIYKSLVG